MLLRLMANLPFINSLVCFPWKAHKLALKKFLVLVIAATLPVIFTALLSTGQGEFVHIVRGSVSVSEQFIYAASFLTPSIYLFWEKYESTKDGENGEKKKLQPFRLYPGYGWIFIASTLLLLVTALSFTAIKMNKPWYEQTIMYGLLNEGALYVYLFSLFSYYVSIVEAIPGAANFVDVEREKENSLKKSFKERLASRGGKND